MPEILFIVDTMLGTLAKWLRVLGFDTLYEAGMDDDTILQLAIQDEGIIISRDRELCGRKPDSILLRTTDLDEQIISILNIYSADKNKILSRCLDCNTVLEIAVPEGNVPEDIIQHYDEFWHCEDCGKYYWPGSHYENMKKKANIFHLLSLAILSL